MMKRNILIAVCAIISIFTSNANTRLEPQSAFENREQARTRTFSYPSEVAAKEGSLARSQYIRPLDGEWQQSGRGGFSQTFSVPFAWADREIFVYVEKMSGPFHVKVNDQLVGMSAHGTTPLEFDITPYAKEGANTIELSGLDIPQGTVTANVSIEGDVIVHAQPRIRVRDFEARTIFNRDDAGASVELDIKLKSHLLNSKTVTVYYSLLDPSGEQVNSGRQNVETDMRREESVRFLIPVELAKPWTHETPELYTVVLRVQHEGRFTEYVAYRFGMRNIAFGSGEVYINGRKIPFTMARYLTTADRQTTETELRELKRSGINMVMAEKQPQPEYFYELCDEIGLYVCDQAAVNIDLEGAEQNNGPRANPFNLPYFSEVIKDRILSTYLRSRNHASVVMFSLGGDVTNGYNLQQAYLTLKELERQRPLIFLAADGEWNSDAVSRTTAERYPASVAGRIVLSNGNDGSASVAGQSMASTDIRPSAQLVKSNDKASYVIRNNAAVTDLRGNVHYTVKEGSKIVSEGVMPVRVAPQQENDFDIPLGSATRAVSRLKFDVTLRSNLD